MFGKFKRRTYYAWIGSGVVIALLTTMVLRAHAQQRRLVIIEPQENQTVAEELTVTVSRPNPDQGYLIFKLDGVFKEATSQVQYVINTKELTDGPHTIVVEDHDGTGALKDTAQVTFRVANRIGAAEATQSAVPLNHWDPELYESKEITRYHVWAQGIASDNKPKMAMGGGGAGGPGGPGGGQQQQGPDVIVLDRQLSLKIRQTIRDILPNGTANIRTIVEGGHERWRHYEQASMEPDTPPTFAGAGGWCFSGGAKAGGQQQAGGMGGPMMGGGGALGPGGGAGMGSGPPVPVWDGDGSCELCTNFRESGTPPAWCPSFEVGRSYTRTVYPSGKEVNATRKYEVWPYDKGARFAMSELQPMFADRPVRPGDTWNSEMTFVCELAERRGIRTVAPLRFTGFEWQGGRKTAKLETEFNLTEEKAKEVATVCIDFVGAGSQGGIGGDAVGGGLGPGAQMGAVAKKKPPKFTKPPYVRIKRVIYFDYARKKILRTEDQVTSRFEFKPATTTGMGGPAGMGGMPGMGGGASAQGGGDAKPENWTYNVTIITQLDESPAIPNAVWNKGGINAHDYDHVPEKNDRPIATRDPRSPQNQ